jgi:spore germination protein GerM
MTQLLLGLTPEEASAGMQSAFSAYTAGTIRGVVVENGVATLDLTKGFELTNNFSTTNLSGIVLGQISATVLQFPEITKVEHTIEGKRWCGWESGDCPDR